MVCYGYVRTLGKSPKSYSTSVNSLRGLGVADVIVDHTPMGPANEITPVFAQLLKRLRSGDRLAVYRLADLGLSLCALAAVATELHNRNIILVVIGDGFDFGGSCASVRLQTLRAAACASAVVGARAGNRGRPSKTPPAMVIEARQRLAEGRKVSLVASELGISSSSLYRALRRRDSVAVA